MQSKEGLLAGVAESQTMASIAVAFSRNPRAVSIDLSVTEP
jgi:hypothetical protein